MSKEIGLEEIQKLIISVRRAYHRLRNAGDQVHGFTGISAPKRTLIMDISCFGPQTVPELAGQRFISRQIVQNQINELIEAGIVKTQANPNHKRSSLISLTAKGKKMIARMLELEKEMLKDIDWLPEPEELSTCLRVLDLIYERLEVE